MAYDVCQCYTQSMMELSFRTTDSLDVDLETREISIQKELSKLGQDDKNFFQIQTGEPGNVIYKDIDGLLADYKSAMQKYNDDLNDYNSLENQGKIMLMSLLEFGLGQGSKEIVDAFSNLTAAEQKLVEETIEKNKIPTKEGEASEESSEKKTTEEKKESEFAKEVTKAGKKLLSNQFDFMNAIIGVQSKPVKPNAPVATFTEGRIKGSIKNTEVTKTEGGWLSPRYSANCI